jgi:hypothetical protein
LLALACCLPATLGFLVSAGSRESVALSGLALQSATVTRIERLATVGDNPVARAVAVRDGKLYAGFGSRLVVRSASDMAPTAVQGSVALRGDIIALAVAPPLVFALTTVAFQVVDVSDPAQPKLTALLDVGSVYSGGLVVAGHLAYVGSPDGLRVIDVSIPSRPVIVGQLAGVERIMGLSLAGDILALVTYDQDTALVLVDVQDPTTPRELGRLLRPDLGSEGWVESFSGVALAGSLAFVTSNGAGTGWFLVADVSKPAAPAWIGQRRFRMNGSVSRVQVRDSLAYVSAGVYGFMRIDVSRPTAPSAPVWWPTSDKEVMDLALDGSIVFLATTAGVDALTDSDAQGAKGVRVLGELATGGAGNMQVAADGGRAYISNGAAGTLDVVDIGDPAAPRRLGSLGGLGNVRALAAADERAYAASESAPLAMIDASDATRPQLSAVVTGTLFSDLVVSDGLLYGASPSDGLVIIDVHDSAAPHVLSRQPLTEAVAGARSLAVSGERAYLLGKDGGLVILDIADPGAPRRLGQLAEVGQNPADLALTGTSLLIVSHGSLLAVNVADPTAPVVTSQLLLPVLLNSPIAIEVLGQHALVSDVDREAGNPAIFDLADPARPRLMSAAGLNSGPMTVDLSLGLALVVSIPFDGPGSLKLLDVAHPTDFLPHAGLALPGAGEDVAYRDGHAFVAAGFQDLHVVDVLNPAAPRLVATLDVGAPVYHIAVEGDRAYLVSQRGFSSGLRSWDTRLSIVDISRPARPSLVGTFPLGDLDVQDFDVQAGRAYALTGQTETPAIWGWSVAGSGAPILVGAASLLFTRGPSSEVFVVNANRFALIGSTAYLASADGSLVALDIADLSHPVIVGQLALGEIATDVAVVDGMAYVLTSQPGATTVAIADIANRAQPRFRGRLALDHQFRNGRIVSDGNRAWVVDSYRGELTLADVADPDRPQTLATYRSPTADDYRWGGRLFRGLVMNGDHAYLATADAVLWSLGTTDDKCGGRCVFLPLTGGG